MINITYLPANDPFHAIFRMFFLFPNEDEGPCPYDVARILDFYVCFPFLLSYFKCPRRLIKRHNALKHQYAPNTYQMTPKPTVLFNRMCAAQSAAISSLQSYGFIELAAFEDGNILRTQKKMPDKVFLVVEQYRNTHAELVDFLGELKTLPLYGASGLRARSELEEYRYDNV